MQLILETEASDKANEMSAADVTKSVVEKNVFNGVMDKQSNTNGNHIVNDSPNTTEDMLSEIKTTVKVQEKEPGVDVVEEKSIKCETSDKIDILSELNSDIDLPIKNNIDHSSDKLHLLRTETNLNVECNSVNAKDNIETNTNKRDRESPNFHEKDNLSSEESVVLNDHGNECKDKNKGVFKESEEIAQKENMKPDKNEAMCSNESIKLHTNDKLECLDADRNNSSNVSGANDIVSQVCTRESDLETIESEMDNIVEDNVNTTSNKSPNVSIQENNLESTDISSKELLHDENIEEMHTDTDTAPNKLLQDEHVQGNQIECTDDVACDTNTIMSKLKSVDNVNEVDMKDDPLNLDKIETNFKETNLKSSNSTMSKLIPVDIGNIDDNMTENTDNVNKTSNKSPHDENIQENNSESTDIILKELQDENVEEKRTEITGIASNELLLDKHTQENKIESTDDVACDTNAIVSNLICADNVNEVDMPDEPLNLDKIETNFEETGVQSTNIIMSKLIPVDKGSVVENMTENANDLDKNTDKKDSKFEEFVAETTKNVTSKYTSIDNVDKVDTPNNSDDVDKDMDKSNIDDSNCPKNIVSEVDKNVQKPFKDNILNMVNVNKLNEQQHDTYSIEDDLNSSLENEIMKVDDNESIKVDENEIMKVDKNESIKVEKNETIQVDESMEVDDSKIINVDENESMAVDESKIMKVGKNERIEVDQYETMQVDENESIKVDEIEIMKVEEVDKLNEPIDNDSLAKMDLCPSEMIQDTGIMNSKDIVDNKVVILEDGDNENTKDKTISSLLNSGLSNTLDILSDDEEESTLKTKNIETDKTCINLIDNDDDIMLIEDDSSSKDSKETGKAEDVSCSTVPDKMKKDDIIESCEPEVVLESKNIESKDTSDLDKSFKKDEEATSLKTVSTDSTKENSNTKVTLDHHKNEKEIVKPMGPLMAPCFVDSFKSKINDMTRDDLEEFCLVKIIEGIVDRSNLSDIKTKLKTMVQHVEEWRKKAMMLTKQTRDLQIVLKTVQEEHKKRTDGLVTPLRITRSVGMQVSSTDSKNTESRPGRRKQALTNSQNIQNPQNQSSMRGTNKKSGPTQSPIPVPRLVPAANVAPAKTVRASPPQVRHEQPIAPKTASSPQNVARQGHSKSAEKRPHGAQSVTVDLTDDEPPAKQQAVGKQAPTHTVRLVPPQQLMPPAAYPSGVGQGSNPRKVYIPISGTQSQNLRPGQTIMFKTVQPTTNPRPRTPNANNMRMAHNSLLKSQPRLSLNRHPAPLPDATKQLQSPNWKALPPAPDLKISKVENGIVISWKIEGYQEDSYEEIASYQLYAYQETSSPPDTLLWKKIGDVKALPLPMACTLTQFIAGYKYYFAVRAVDVKSRIGPFSLPGSILLLNK